MKLWALGVCGMFALQAPLQCSSEPEPSMRTYETPGEALYGLAQQFHASGDQEAWRATLQYLIARYPNSRYAGMARADLEKAGAPTAASSAK